MVNETDAAVAEAKVALEGDGFPFFIQLIGDGDEPGTVSIGVFTGQGAQARRYFEEHPLSARGIEIPVTVDEVHIIPASFPGH